MAYTPKTSNEAVKKATGKTWPEWFAVLDKAGAKKMRHIDIARHIYEKYLGEKKTKLAPDVAKKGGWWSQMVSVEYERSRGLRAVNQSSTHGYNVSVHKTFDVSVPKLKSRWVALTKKDKSLNKLVDKKSTQKNLIRYDLGGELVTAMFAPKPGGSRIALEHMRMAKKGDIEKRRKFWRNKVEQL